MTRLRAGRRVGWWSVFVVAVLLAAGAVLLSAGPALAGGSVFCPPYGSDTAADVQSAANSGGTVFIKGVCVGTVDLTTSVTLQGVTSGATSGLDGANVPRVVPVVLQDAGATTVTLRNLLVTGGNNSGDGGGERNIAGCGATTNVISSRVISNTSGDWGGGLNAESCTVLNVNNSLVSGNHADFNGGGIVGDDADAVNVTASTVSNNTADNGGGISASGTSTVTLTNSTVSGNTAASDGGGIYTSFTYLALTGTTVDHNTATTVEDFGVHGGGVYVTDSVLYANASTFASNKASSFDFGEPSGDGGGIRVFDSNAQLVASRVLGNLANDDGGGIAFAGQCSTFCLSDAPINHVVSKAFPDPFSIPDGLTLDGTTVDHNQAVSGAGGGLQLEADEESNESPTTLMNSTVSNNVTLDTSTFGESGGAGIAQWAQDDNTASLTTSNTNIYGNRSNSVGGGIANFAFNGGTATVSTGQTTNFQSPNALQVGNQAKYGGGVYNAGEQASVSLNAGTKMARNKATVNGGGVFNDCGASLFVAPGVVLLANYPNNIFTSFGCLVD